LKQAVILCGGAGTRLGSLTADTPKPLLPVGDRPFLEHLMQEVTRYGFQEILLLTGHLGEQFDHYQGATINHAKITVMREDIPLGTWGGVIAARDLLDDVFLLMNGDSWLDYDLTHLHNIKPDGIHMIGRYVKQADRYETLNINKEYVKEIIPRGEAKGGFINSGIYVVNKDVIGKNEADKVGLEHDILPILADAGRLTVETCQNTTFFIDIGVPEDYANAQISIMQQRQRPALFIDRDNTLTVDHGYTHHPDDMVFKDGAIDLIHYANHLGYYVFVVTNQGGVTKGEYDEHYVLDFHRKMQYTLVNHNAHLDALTYEIGLDSPRRKPQPGMITDLMKDWPVDIGRSIMIGDKVTDVEAGQNAGIVSHLYISGNIFELFKDYLS
jgi:D,D-heptose 1,7-bisphosphate phosphatase